MRLPLVLALLLALVGCKTMTPEQQAVADRAQAAYTAAGQRVEAIAGTIEAHIAEYDAIRARIAAGETLPEAIKARYAELAALLQADRTNYEGLKAALAEAKKARDAALAAGVPWYESIPWGLIGSVLVGAAGVYFPVARPAAMAAQAVIQGIANHSSTDSAGGATLKGTVLDSARAMGIEAYLDKLVQKYDPPGK